MTIKGGARQETVFETVRILLKKGMTVDQAIEEVESLLRGKLPEIIVDKIKEELG